jgi:hypothetical protein
MTIATRTVPVIAVAKGCRVGKYCISAAGELCSPTFCVLPLYKAKTKPESVHSTVDYAMTMQEELSKLLERMSCMSQSVKIQHALSAAWSMLHYKPQRHKWQLKVDLEHRLIFVVLLHKEQIQ